MTDPRLRRPEQQIIILRAVEPLPERKREKQPPLHHEQMTDIIVAQQIIVIKIRLPVWLKEPLCTLVALVLIRVENLTVRPEYAACCLEQRIRRKKIIVIQKGHILSCGILRSRVGIAGNAAVDRKMHISDARIPFEKRPCCLLYPSALAGIRQDELPESVGLRLERAEKLLQINPPGLVGGTKHRNFRCCPPGAGRTEHRLRRFAA